MKSKNIKAEINFSLLKSYEYKIIRHCKSCSEISLFPRNLLRSKNDTSEILENQYFTVEYELKCHHCSTELSRFLKTGQSGCPFCYSAFEKEIKYFFKREPKIQQGKISHSTLSDLLKIAVELENFEFAASLRDHLKVISAKEANEKHDIR